ncbi:hypothetical protein GN958_ATG13490 [Phytophthora infestans]|uniref:Secreted RxLR effector peptide protein n=1 Tax=Phytophthora infestans TaxID=4787 RepID=A0A8S9U8X3_PHYIN|nr:hypothetical protein GN958_ATG13490 [Phytophthora infestans]
MKFTTLAVTTLVAVAGVASATDYQPALRALAVPEPVAPVTAGHNVQHPAAATAPIDAAGKEVTHADNKDGDDKKNKEWATADSAGEARGEAGADLGQYSNMLNWRFGVTIIITAIHKKTIISTAQLLAIFSLQALMKKPSQLT